MSWFFLALLAAFTQATSDAILKLRFSDLNPYEMGTLRLIYAVPWLIAALVIIPVPPLDREFFITVALALPVEIGALMCYMAAIRTSPLSITLPMLAFTPAFLVASGWAILGERLSLPSILGIGLIVAGSYCLNISDAKKGILLPLRAMFKDRGPRLMLVTALLYSITSALGKRAILHSSPAFFGVFYFVCLTAILVCLLPLVSRGGVKHLAGRPVAGLVLGAVYAVMVFSHTAAISLTQAAPMIALKRTSLLFGVIYGAVLFKEQNIRARLFASCLMVAGVIVLGFMR